MPQHWSHFLKQDCLKSPQGAASPSTLSPTSVPTRPMGRFSFGSQGSAGSPQASSPCHSPVSRRRVQQQQQQQPIMGAGVSAGAFKICTCCVMHLAVILLLLRFTDHKMLFEPAPHLKNILNANTLICIASFARIHFILLCHYFLLEKVFYFSFCFLCSLLVPLPESTAWCAVFLYQLQSHEQGN